MKLYPRALERGADDAFGGDSWHRAPFLTLDEDCILNWISDGSIAKRQSDFSGKGVHVHFLWVLEQEQMEGQVGSIFIVNFSGPEIRCTADLI